MKTLVSCLAASILAVALPRAATAQITLSLPQAGVHMIDFDEMLKRRIVRILVPYSRTYFFFDRGNAIGATAETGQEFEKWLNDKHKMKGAYRIHVVFIPTRRDKLFESLVAGRGDIAAGSLTVTPEREALVDFAKPWTADAREVLVTGPAAPQIQSLNDLSGKEILVRTSSSYYPHLMALSDSIKAKAKPINLKAADENLEDEDLLDMVAAGMLPWAVVDLHKAKLWAGILKGLTVREDLVVHQGGELAWAIRKNSPKLKAAADEFVTTHGLATSFGADIGLRYFKSGKTIKNALSNPEAKKFEALRLSFNNYGEKFRIDPLLIAAQGYQESALVQSLRSRAGAVGIMQIKPSTAAEKDIAIARVIEDADANIHAGSKYVRFLVDKYINDPNVNDLNRVLMALAGYNAGPGSLKKMREHAAKNGYDPNVWFGNVENSAAILKGYETVQYVGNIYKYYIAYSVLKSDKQASGESKPPNQQDAK